LIGIICNANNVSPKISFKIHVFIFRSEVEEGMMRLESTIEEGDEKG
jgi:hypothetical protein